MSPGDQLLPPDHFTLFAAWITHICKSFSLIRWIIVQFSSQNLSVLVCLLPELWNESEHLFAVD